MAGANHEGGVGTVTPVCGLASYLSLDGHRILLIDLDPQGNATMGSWLDKRAVTHSVYEALVG